ncbi:transposase [Streptomyces sp. NBC_01754]|nr:transposase [Streptomyces sp. NBC_01754]
MVDDISHEGLRILLREEGVSFQRLKIWKTSRDPDYAAKKSVEHLYAITDDVVIPEDGEPEVIFCTDEFGPLNLMPHPGKQWAERGGRHKDPDREPRRRRRATYNRYGGVRHLFAALDLAKDKLYGRIKPVKKRTQFLEFCRYLRTLCPREVRIAIVRDNFSPHLTTKRCQRVGTWAAANNVEIAYTPTSSSWLNRIEAQFTALRYFTLDGTDHADHKEQGSMIRRYIIRGETATPTTSAYAPSSAGQTLLDVAPGQLRTSRVAGPGRRDHEVSAGQQPVLIRSWRESGHLAYAASCPPQPPVPRPARRRTGP